MNANAFSANLFHPATRILLWVLFAAAVAMMGWSGLSAASLLLALALAGLRDRACLTMLRRARWLLISLLLVYGLATPGPGLVIGEVPLPVSQGGLEAGLLQAWRLVAMIAGLALLLALTPVPQLVAGIHAILSPLRIFGIDPETTALRLSLTLEYARALGRPKGKSWRDALVAALEPDDEPPSRVVVERPPFTWHDSLALAAGVAALIAAW
jgi:energy-coupling factor transporter transmembrane protein EcfT